MKTMKPVIGLLAATALSCGAYTPHAAADTLQDLQKQLKLLQQKVAELEKKQAAEKKASEEKTPPST